jgi:hypothetical protein
LQEEGCMHLFWSSHKINQAWLKLYMEGRPWPDFELHGRPWGARGEGRDVKVEEEQLRARLAASSGEEGGTWGIC